MTSSHTSGRKSRPPPPHPTSATTSVHIGLQCTWQHLTQTIKIEINHNHSQIKKTITRTLPLTLNQARALTAAEMIFDMLEGFSETLPAISPPAFTPRSPLMELPGELRNHIYRLVLLEITPIKIDKHLKPLQPALLQLSQQTRRETADIYYKENVFAFSITHFDACIYISWCRSSSRRRWCSTVANISKSKNFNNLVVWLEAYFKRECGGPREQDDGKANADSKAATHLFKMVRLMREVPGLDWTQANAILESAHEALTELKPRWAWRTTTTDLITTVE